MHEFVGLIGYYGKGGSKPTDGDLKEALSELFASKDEEHPSTWIECGAQEGPLYSIAIYGSGYALYTKYSDLDMTDELENKKIENVNEITAFQLWKNLIDGNVEKI